VYTQCPDCTTVFRVTADALRTAQGNVRCGVCSTSFNALENLSEEPFRAGPETEYAPALEDTITVEEMPGAEDIELSTAAEAVSTSEPAEEQSFEFNGDIEELDRLFVEMPATELQHIAAAAHTGEQPPLPTIDPGTIAASLTIGHHDLARTGEYPILVPDESDEFIIAPDEFQPSSFGTSRISIPDEMRKGLAEEAAANAINAPNFAEPDAEQGPHRWPWAMGTAILMLTLVAQVVHGQRDQLIRKPVIGPLLAQIYSLVGLPLSAPMDLASYELRQWGATSDAKQAGRLLLRASIVNRANYAQPYPLLRLALQDRFGTTVGMRDIQPVDYLPGSGAGNLLEPGQRADAEIRIVDPGRDAVGFEMDVCLSMTDGVRCANQTPPARP
jgi:predicted Zn finger-like uncharacterized protein